MVASGTKVAVWNRALMCIGSTVRLESEDESTAEAEACRLVHDDVVREMLAARRWPWAIRQRSLSQIDEQISDTAGDDNEIDFQVLFPFLESSQLIVSVISSGGTETVKTAVTDYTFTAGEAGTVGIVTMNSAPQTGETLRIKVTSARVGWEHLYQLPADCVKPLGLLPIDQPYLSLSFASRPKFDVVINDGGTGLILCTDLDTSEFVLDYLMLVDDIGVMPRDFVTALAWRIAIELAGALKKDIKLIDYCEQRYTQALSIASANAQNVGNAVFDPNTSSVSERG